MGTFSATVDRQLLDERANVLIEDTVAVAVKTSTAVQEPKCSARIVQLTRLRKIGIKSGHLVAGKLIQ
jgi:hypothetical protein